MYSLNRQPGSPILEIALSGFWDLEIFGSFKRDFEKAILQMSAGGRPHGVLVDLEHVAIQSQLVMQAFQSLLERQQPKPLRMAFYAPTALARMQSRRILTGEDMRLFDSKTEGLEWLLGEFAIPLRLEGGLSSDRSSYEAVAQSDGLVPLASTNVFREATDSLSGKPPRASIEPTRRPRSD